MFNLIMLYMYHPSLKFLRYFTSAILPVYKMNLIRFDRYIGASMIMVMVSEILTLLYTVWFIYKEIKVFKSIGYKKYFQVCIFSVGVY